MSLSGKTVVLGITGGIAAYKAAELTSRLRKAGATVHVVMTENATKFIAPLTLQTLSNNTVSVDTFAHPVAWEVEHISLAQRAEVFLVAPATANILAKMAHGIADDMLSTTILATKAPVFVAPAMNTAMLHHPATEANLALLRQRGVRMITPGQGLLACGDTGDGRLAEPVDIVATLEAFFEEEPGQDFAGKRVLVTAGPTREAIDPVRFLSNRSSGKMGYALAEAARDRGAEVTLLTGPVSLIAPSGMRVLPFETTEALFELMQQHGTAQDVVIQAAAPADFRMETTSSHKLKKQDKDKLVLELVPNPDVAAYLGAHKQAGQVLVGFAAETERLTENAQGKLARKGLDLIVANDVTEPGAGFAVDTNIATLIWKDGQEVLPQMTKVDLANRILTKIAQEFLQKP